MTRPTNTRFADWCAAILLREEVRFLNTVPADQYWQTIDDTTQIMDRLEAALSRKVEINVR